MREADTLVRVHERETIVIAGLMEERERREVRKLPFLGDLPGVGASSVRTHEPPEDGSRHSPDADHHDARAHAQATAKALERVPTR